MGGHFSSLLEMTSKVFKPGNTIIRVEIDRRVVQKITSLNRTITDSERRAYPLRLHGLML